MKAIIGLEIHLQLLTESKLFCSCNTRFEGKAPNENTCPICLGFPGSKPKVNKKSIDQAIVIAMALDCRVLPEFYFSRKSYFYPDMAKNFQITQYEIPLAVNGHLKLNDKRISIKRVHLEEDPARLIHVGGDITSSKYTLIDYNRAGMPLVEIVTEPDIESTQEARAFLEKISLILEHLGVYDPSGEGSLRIDANLSIEGGQRVEVKNITGFKNVEKALNYEVVRQQSLSNMGMEISRETRHYDAATNTTHSLRKKEHEEDYGYITEPDLVKIRVGENWVKSLTDSMPELPDARIERFINQYDITRHQAKILVNTGLDLSNFYEETNSLYRDPKSVANWMITYLLKSLNYQDISLRESRVRPRTFVELLELIDDGIISERLAKELIKDYVETGISPKKLVKERGLTLLDDEKLREEVVAVLEENRQALDDYYSGTNKVVDFLMGQVLRRIKARGDAGKVRSLILAILDGEEKEPR